MNELFALLLAIVIYYLLYIKREHIRGTKPVDTIREGSTMTNVKRIGSNPPPPPCKPPPPPNPPPRGRGN